MKKHFMLVCFLVLFFSPFCFAETSVKHDIYFDSFTGHKYVKLNAVTYAEYSKKGTFLKNVPAELPVFTEYDHVYPIGTEDYILYEKSNGSSAKQKLLPGKNSHPKGWRAEKLFLAIN